MKKALQPGTTLQSRYKICRGCDERKPIFEFYEKMFAKDGYDSRCKECHKKQTAARYKERMNSNPNIKKAESERKSKQYYAKKLKNNN